MKIEISFTDDDLCDESNKTLCYFKNGQLFLSNTVDIKHVGFFRDIISDFSEIVYYEDDQPECPDCGCIMDNNGSRPVKPNKLDGFRKEQYICPECGKTKVTSLEPFIGKYSNFSHDICEKGLNYDYIGSISYGKKNEMISFENDVKVPRQTIYYHQTKYDELFFKRQEELNSKLLEQNGIGPTGYYHYDEQYPRQNGEQMVRLALIDAINNLPINELIVYKKDFDKELVEAFLESSLIGLPKEALITDGARMYPDIIDKIGLKHQLCVFHIIKNHHLKTYRTISRLSRRIRTINRTIADNKRKIDEKREELKNSDLTKKQKKKKRTKIDDLIKSNKKLRTERKEKKNELNELLKTNECVENIYNADDKKGSQRRFNTANNRKEFLDKNSCSFFESLDKKFNRTITYYDDPNIPRTNNNIERYFGITLPHNMKRKFRTIGGLTRYLRIQKIRWVRRNVLHEFELKNISMTQYLQEKDWTIT